MAEPPGTLKEKVPQTPIPKKAKDEPVKINSLERKLEQLFRDSLSTNQKKSEAAVKAIKKIEVDALPFLIKKLSNEREAQNAFFIAAQILDARNEFGKTVYYNEMYFEIALDGLAVIGQLNEKIQNGNKLEKMYASMLLDKIPVLNLKKSMKDGKPFEESLSRAVQNFMGDMNSGDLKRKEKAGREVNENYGLRVELIKEWKAASPAHREKIAEVFTDSGRMDSLITMYDGEYSSTIQEILNKIGQPALENIQKTTELIRTYGKGDTDALASIEKREMIMRKIRSNQQ